MPLGSRQGVRDVVVSAVPHGITVVTGVITSILIARGLGPEGLGRYTLATSGLMVILNLSDLGIRTTGTRYAARAAAQGQTREQMAVLRWALRLQTLMTAAVTLGFFLAAPFLAVTLWHDAALMPLLRLSLLGAVAGVLYATPLMYYRSARRFGMSSAVLIAGRLGSLLGVTLLAWLDQWSVAKVIVANVVVGALAHVPFNFLVPRESYVAPRDEGQRRLDLHDLLRSPDIGEVSAAAMDGASPGAFAQWYMLAALIQTLIAHAGIWLMGHYLSQSEIGLYNVATRFSFPLEALANALITVVWPRASAATEASHALSLMKRILWPCALLAVAAAVYSLAVPFAAPWVFGASYAGSTLIGQVLCLRHVVSLLAVPITSTAYSFGFVRISWWTQLFKLLCVLGINVALLPVIGALASALALVFSDVLGLLITGWLVWRGARGLRQAAEA